MVVLDGEVAGQISRCRRRNSSGDIDVESGKCLARCRQDAAVGADLYRNFGGHHRQAPKALLEPDRRIARGAVEHEQLGEISTRVRYAEERAVVVDETPRVL